MYINCAFFFFARRRLRGKTFTIISEVGETPGDLKRHEGPQISFIYTPFERTNESSHGL